MVTTGWSLTMTAQQAVFFLVVPQPNSDILISDLIFKVFTDTLCNVTHIQCLVKADPAPLLATALIKYVITLWSTDMAHIV